MQTSDPDIYAGGDVGNVGALVNHGDVAFGHEAFGAGRSLGAEGDAADDENIGSHVENLQRIKVRFAAKKLSPETLSANCRKRQDNYPHPRALHKFFSLVRQGKSMDKPCNFNEIYIIFPWKNLLVKCCRRKVPPERACPARGRRVQSCRKRRPCAQQPVPFGKRQVLFLSKRKKGRNAVLQRRLGADAGRLFTNGRFLFTGKE